MICLDYQKPFLDAFHKIKLTDLPTISVDKSVSELLISRGRFVTRQNKCYLGD